MKWTQTIALPTPDGYYLADIQYLSERLFNQDDLVELVYEYDYSVIPYRTSTNVYSLPEGLYSGSLDILDMNGRKILSFPVTAETGNVGLPVGQLSSGTYLYQLNTDAGEKVADARKILIR